jgi:hypothetical protein
MLQHMLGLALRRARGPLAGDAGCRELLSRLCEALACELHASDCLVSRIDPARGVSVDLAGFTCSPERWQAAASEHVLETYPATRSVLAGGRPYTTWVGDPAGDPAERLFLSSIGVRAGLLMRLDGDGGPYLVEVWSDTRSRAFGRWEIRRARRLVRWAGRQLEQARMRDAEERRSFLRAADQAREIGAADIELPELAGAVADALRLDSPAVRQVRLVALVHEAGKSHIPEPLRAKRAPLTPVEWAIVQRHTLIGQRMLARMPYLRDAVAGVGAIREHWDGGGYPHGLAGEQIPLSARIVAVCAAYQAMRRGGPRREALGHGQALAELRAGAGSQFDPAVVASAVSTIDPTGARPIVRLRVAAI